MSRQTLTPADRTLGHAWMMGLQPYAMCLRGKRSGPVKTQPCGYRSMLCLETTEADGVKGITDRMFDDAGGWTDPNMKHTYRRAKSRNAQKVVELRQAARKGS